MGDIYPEGVQLKKGDYTLRVLLRHDDAQLLEKLKVGELHGAWGARALCSVIWERSGEGGAVGTIYRNAGA